MHRRPLAMLMAISTIFALPAMAAADPIAVTDAWTRPVPANGRTAAIYLTLTNSGGADRLLRADTGLGHAGLHQHTMDNGIMRMRDVEAIDIPATGTVRLAPGGLHIMVTAPKLSLHEGDRFDVTLAFDHAPSVTVPVAVSRTPPTTSEPDPMAGMKMN